MPGPVATTVPSCMSLALSVGSSIPPDVTVSLTDFRMSIRSPSGESVRWYSGREARIADENMLYNVGGVDDGGGRRSVEWRGTVGQL